MNREGRTTETAVILHLDMGTASSPNGDFERTPAAHNNGTLVSLIRRHEGQVIETKPERLLAEFHSSVGAVRCALEIQEELRDRKRFFGIGIGGAVVRKTGGQVSREAVKIATHLSHLAKPDGICISGAIQEQVDEALSFAYKDLGERRLKENGEPIRAYLLLIEAKAPGSRFFMDNRAPLLKWRGSALAVGFVLFLIAGLLLFQKSCS
jgi:adenylate cyclase